MFEYSSKTEILLYGLESRLNRCIDLRKLIQDAPSEYKTERRVKFNKAIAFLFHFMISAPNIKYIIDNIYLIYQRVNKDQEYISHKKEAKKLAKEIISLLRKRPDFQTMLKRKETFYRFYMLIPRPKKITEIFNEIGKVPEFNFNSNFFGKIISSLRSISSLWITFNDKMWDEIIVKLEECEKTKRSLEYHDSFIIEYENKEQLDHLLLTYKSFNPKYDYTLLSADELTLTSLLNKGDADHFLPSDQLLSDAKAIVDHVKQNMHIAVSIQFHIEQFKIFASLYNSDFIENFTNEKVFQKEFEKFSFLQGYFPLSEIQFKNARIDDLLQDKESSFLFEIKFARIKDSQRIINGKIKSSLAQSKKYFEYLKVLPGLRPEVNILIFTQKPLIIYNASMQVELNGITFIYHIIDIFQENASKLKPMEIKISS